MAIDTALKRASAIDTNIPWRTMLPIPDGTVHQADRYASGLLYSGFGDAGAGGTRRQRQIKSLIRVKGCRRR